MRNLVISISIILISCLYMACQSSSKATAYDYSYLYRDEQKLIKPKFKFFHNSTDSSTLYFQIESDDLLFGKLKGDSTLTSRVLCRYKVLGRKGADDIIDSATVPLISYGENAEKNLLQAQVSMAIPEGDLYPVEIKFRDQYRDLNVVYYHWADKRKNGNSQYFLITKGEKIIIQDFLNRGDTYSILRSQLTPNGPYNYHGSFAQYEMTPPPFAMDIESPALPPIDTTIVFDFSKDRISFKPIFPINWIEPEKDSFLRPFFFSSTIQSYPEISEAKQMIEPIRYISTSSEYKKLTQAINLKRELDHFWLKVAKDPERGQKMIAEYYRRVELANRFFTTYREGWKTDRGIILVVYGEPSTIYKDINSETWIYGEENNILSIRFQFKLIDHPMTKNEFRLIRNSDYKNNWYRAVDAWRQAKYING